MKYLITILLAIMFVAASCKKKCHECHYDHDGAEVRIGEFCGDEVETLEANGYVVADSIHEVHCHEH